MDLKKIDLDKLQDYAFTPNEIAAELIVSNQKFINFKCLDNEDLIPTVKAVPLDRIKQAKEDIENINPVYSTIGDRIPVLKNCDDIKEEVLAILDKLIAESEDK